MAKSASLDALRDSIRQSGLRATPARIAVLDVLRASDAPMSHGDIVDRLAAERFDRATIYRNLTDLTQAGLVRRTDVGDHVWRFEARREDGDHVQLHPHFVCTECGSVECLPEIELAVRRRAPRAIRQRQVEVHVRGLCDACI